MSKFHLDLFSGDQARMDRSSCDQSMHGKLDTKSTPFQECCFLHFAMLHFVSIQACVQYQQREIRRTIGTESEFVDDANESVSNFHQGRFSLGFFYGSRASSEDSLRKNLSAIPLHFSMNTQASNVAGLRMMEKTLFRIVGKNDHVSKSLHGAHDTPLFHNASHNTCDQVNSLQIGCCKCGKTS